MMRKLLTLLAVAGLSVANLFAQGLVDYRSLEKKLEKSNESIANEKKAQKLGTWMDRGELMVKIFNTYQGNLTFGMDQSTFALLMGRAQGERDEQIGDKTYHVLETERVDYYYADGKYTFFKVKTPLVEDPLGLAFAAYNKAIELDPEKKKENSVTESLIQLRNAYVNAGLNAYKQTDYAGAIKDFQGAIAIDPLATGKKFVLDSTLNYCLGFSQAANKEYAAAFESYSKSIQLGYTMDGEVLCLLADVALQDSVLLPKAYEVLKEGLAKYPNQKCIMLSLIDNTIRQGRDPKEVIKYVETALTEDPNNPFLNGILGNVYEKLGDVEAAEKYYRKAIALKPDWYDMLYNVAILHYNRAASLQTEAVNLPRGKDADYDRLMADANKELHVSISVLEELTAAKNDHDAALDLLRQLYFRFRMEDGMQAKYDATVKRLEELGQGQ